MYDARTRGSALQLLARGLTVSKVSRRTRISRWALGEWRRRADRGRPLHSPGTVPCPRREVPAVGLARADKYAYLLGLYLGDWC
jgi:hypothetical protein